MAAFTAICSIPWSPDPIFWQVFLKTNTSGFQQNDGYCESLVHWTQRQPQKRSYFIGKLHYNHISKTIFKRTGVTDSVAVSWLPVAINNSPWVTGILLFTIPLCSSLTIWTDWKLLLIRIKTSISDVHNTSCIQYFKIFMRKICGPMYGYLEATSCWEVSGELAGFLISSLFRLLSKVVVKWNIIVL